MIGRVQYRDVVNLQVTCLRDYSLFTVSNLQLFSIISVGVDKIYHLAVKVANLPLYGLKKRN